jgi:hypothetical protein
MAYIDALGERKNCFNGGKISLQERTMSLTVTISERPVFTELRRAVLSISGRNIGGSKGRGYFKGNAVRLSLAAMLKQAVNLKMVTLPRIKKEILYG